MTSIFAFALVLMQPLDFPGGTTLEFMEAMANAGAPIVVAPAVPEAPPLAVSGSDEEAWWQAFDDTALWIRSEEDPSVLRLQAFPDYVFGLGATHWLEEPDLAASLSCVQPGEAGADWVVNTEEGKSIRVGQLAQFEWPKMLKVHWVLSSQHLVARDLCGSPEDVLTAVARSVGGKFVAGDDEWEITIEPRTIRSQYSVRRAYFAQRLAGKTGTSDVSRRLRHIYGALAWQAATEADVREVLATELTTITLVIPTQGRLREAADAVIQDWTDFDRIDDSYVNPAAVIAQRKQLLSRVRWDLPVLAYLTATGGASIALPTGETSSLVL